MCRLAVCPAKALPNRENDGGTDNDSSRPSGSGDRSDSSRDAANFASQIPYPLFGGEEIAGYASCFVPQKEANTGWAWPRFRLGYRGHRQVGQIYGLPKDLGSPPPDREKEFDKRRDSAEKWADPNWIKMFDKKTGYGWKPFYFEYAEFIDLELREKPDGSIGLWLEAAFHEDDPFNIYPYFENFDILEVQAAHPHLRLDKFSLDEWDWFFDTPVLRIFEWSSLESIKPGISEAQEFSTGILDVFATPDGHDSSGVDLLAMTEGWLDDEQNVELQDLLFRTSPNQRFLPSIATEEVFTSPFKSNTIAAGLMANASCELEERIGQKLFKQAHMVAKTGLDYRAALIAKGQQIVDRMFE